MIITKIIDETSTTKRFYLKPDKDLPFKAGQYISLSLPIDPRKSRGIRHYSIANSPNADEVELVIVEKEGGKGTAYLWSLELVTISNLAMEPLEYLPLMTTKKLHFYLYGNGHISFQKYSRIYSRRKH